MDVQFTFYIDFNVKSELSSTITFRSFLRVPWEFLGSSLGVLRVKISNDDNDDGANYKIYNKKVNIKVKLDVLFH